MGDKNSDVVLVGGGRRQGRKEAGSHSPMVVGTTRFGPKAAALMQESEECELMVLENETRGSCHLNLLYTI